MYSKDVITVSNKIKQFFKLINDYLPDTDGNYTDVWDNDNAIMYVYNTCSDLSDCIVNSSFAEKYIHICMSIVNDLESKTYWNDKTGTKMLLDKFVYHISILYTEICMISTLIYRDDIDAEHESDIILLRNDMDKVVDNIEGIYKIAFM